MKAKNPVTRKGAALVSTTGMPALASDWSVEDELEPEPEFELELEPEPAPELELELEPVRVPVVELVTP